ncbi:stage V sporulation protein AA [Caloranaerobacter azorensis]|uniref:Stage V sporulation protein AA n=1 Tax=Caloranaerobacter azorensis TaxID=116090 RepID=A0A6P1YGA2_9FIRM|nr:stage V sporulation protein AA [Caloranaerobacter azorensis]
MKNANVYLFFKTKITRGKQESVRIKDIADIYCEDLNLQRAILDIKLTKIPNDKKFMKISVLEVIKKIESEYKDLTISTFGVDEVLVDINNVRDSNKFLQLIKVFLISLILFIGAGLAIINFHADVNMEKSHKIIYYLITGKKTDNPLTLQIAYSLGIGIGMTIFLNQFGKRGEKEPSPLEIEMYKFKKDIDDYKMNNKNES